MRLAKIHKDSFAFIFLPLAALLNDILIIELGGIFISVYKVMLIISAILFFNPFLFSISDKNHRGNSNITIWFILYCAFLIFSVFYSSGLSIMQKLNYLIFLSCEVIIVLGVSYKIKNTDRQRLMKSFKTTLLIIFFASLFLSTAQLVFRDQILYLGLFSSRKITYAITGFNIERLFLSEFLTFGIAIILVHNIFKGFIRSILVVWVILLILISGSFTGVLGIIGSMFIIYRTRLNIKRVLYPLLLLPLLLLLLQKVSTTSVVSTRLESSDEKLDSYLFNASTKNWRLISSLALIQEITENPTLIGHGYMSSKYFLKNVNYIYSANKYGIDKAQDKENTSHTFITILYDQGLIGFIIFSIFFYQILKLGLKLFFRIDKKLFSNPEVLLTKIFIILVMLRFMFYYHTLNHWHYLLMSIFPNLFIIKQKHLQSNYNEKLTT